MKVQAMNISVLFGLCFGIVLPSPALSQSAPSVPPLSQSRPPAKGADIAGYRIETQGEGALHILHSDGTDVRIPREKGRFAAGPQTLTQETFSDIRRSDDRRHIGWLAGYMMCQQSYPCSAELVIYRPGRELTRIPPAYGIIWRWAFLEAGGQVVVHCGFPHGDATGVYTWHDAGTGAELGRFAPDGEEGPHWVRALRRTER